MLDLELFSDPVIEIDKSFTIVNSNSFFNHFYDISKRKLLNKKLNSIFELSIEQYENDIPFSMLVPHELGIMFGSTLSQNIQLFKTKHPEFEGHTLLHFKDFDAEVRLHNKNLNLIRGNENTVDTTHNIILKQILNHEHCAVFNIHNDKTECLNSHFLPQLKDNTVESFISYLNNHLTPKADWSNFFKILSLNTMDVSDLVELLPEKLNFKNRLLKLQILPIQEDKSIIFLFKDISESNQTEKLIEDQKVLSHFYSLHVKKPTLLNLFISEIHSLVSDSNEQPLGHTLHSLKGLLYFIGLKKFAEDVHILEYITETEKQLSGFENLKKSLSKFLKQNTNNSSSPDPALLAAYNVPYEKYVSLSTIIQNIDELARFYLEFVRDDYIENKINDTYFLNKESAATLLTIFNHLIRNVGAHGDESSYKIEFTAKNNKLIINTSNKIKEKSISNIAFLSGKDLGVNIINKLSNEHDYGFSMKEENNQYSNHFEVKLMKKEELK